MDSTPQNLLLTGATGYIGGRLLPYLKKSPHHLRCMTRHPERLQANIGEDVEVVYGDVNEPASLVESLAGIDTAFYFVHSMGDDGDFEQADRRCAENFVAACNQNNVRRIIYLGGLGEQGPELSAHLRSRQEVGEILATADAQCIEFRASIIIGSGSLSFELIRALVQRLPVMVCPKWVRVKAQPISVEDVLKYLMQSISLPAGDDAVFEIGGPDQISYGELMKMYARLRKLRRYMIPVPFLTPRLSSLWLGLITPLYARVGKKLIEGMKNPTLVSNDLAARTFPIRPRSTELAIARALVHEDMEFAQSHWADAISSGTRPAKWGGVRFGSRLVDSRVREVAVPAAQAFAPIRRIGGTTGWYYADWLWQLRGFLDLLVGGVGSRRGRRDPENVRVGDAVDFWRVEEFVPDHLLRLRAEMRLPGRAWLEFEVRENEGVSTVRQTALFDPVGIFGLAYWYAMYPFHQFIFACMLRNICVVAEEQQHAPSPQNSAP